MRRISLDIEGMTSVACSGTVKRVVTSVDGVSSCVVDLSSRRATLEVADNDAVNVAIEALQDIGFAAELNRSGVDDNVENVLIDIEGMTCAVCTGTVERAALGVEGVEHCAVSLVANRAELRVRGGRVVLDAVLNSIEDAGFGAELVRRHQLGVVHVVFDGTEKRTRDLVYERLQKQVGIEKCTVDAMSVELTYDATKARARHFLAAIRDIDESADIFDEKNDLKLRKHRFNVRQRRESDKWLNNFKLSFALTIPVVFLSVLLDFFPLASDLFRKPFLHSCTLQIAATGILVSPIQLYVARTFYFNAYKSLRSGRANMDVLVVLGTSAAYIYSLVSMVRMMCVPGLLMPTCFETSAFLITFVLCGKYLETLAKGRTSEALAILMDLQPFTASIVDFDKSTGSVRELEEVESRFIEVGEHILVPRGAEFPIDGVIEHGSTSVNESLVTGEAMPQQKLPGSHVIGATMNLDAPVVIQAQSVGSDTVLSNIVRMVEEAQTRKAPIQKYADRIANIFVPVVVALSICTFCVWVVLLKTGFVRNPTRDSSDELFAFMFAIAVMVTSCPCALGLATPTAVMVATGVGARLGMLFKSGAALEGAADVTVVLFDKTGTLTQGTPRVVGTVYMDDTRNNAAATATATATAAAAGRDRAGSEGLHQWIWSAIAAAEMQSEHLLGRALYTHALSHWSDDNSSTPNLTATEFESVSGDGIKVVLDDGSRVQIGTSAYLCSSDILVPGFASLAIASMSDHGQTPILVAINGAVVAVVAVADACRSEAKGCVQELCRQGIEVWMVTGDHAGTAQVHTHIHRWKILPLPVQSIAQQCRIERGHVVASVRPEGKREMVEMLQTRGHSVVFVGDGINDSPALAQADIGIALGTGADIAAASADVVLLRNNLADVLSALHLGKETLRRIHINFLWATVYNLIGIPMSAGVLYPITIPPALAGVAMAFSSVSVVLSSLLLYSHKRFEIGSNRFMKDRSSSISIELSEMLFDEELDDGDEARQLLQRSPGSTKKSSYMTSPMRSRTRRGYESVNTLVS